MNIIEVSQSSETDEWLEARRGLITGTKAADLSLDPYQQTDIDHILDMQSQAKDQADKQRDNAKQAEDKAASYIDQAKVIEEAADIAVQMDEAQAKIDEANEHLAKVTTDRVRAKWSKQAQTYVKKLDNLKEHKQKGVEKSQGLRSKANGLLNKAEEYKHKAESYDTKAEEYKHKADQARIDNMRLKVTAGFWDYAAETMAEPPSAESPMDRGHRLENENARATLAALDIPESEANLDPGIWVNGDIPSLACSPDAHENSLAPRWAIECKSLGSANHLMYVAPILAHRAFTGDDTTNDLGAEIELLSQTILPDYTISDSVREFDFVPPKYQSQVLQYFVVNEELRTLYFSFYDDRFWQSAIRHVYLTINRDTISEEVAKQRAQEHQSLMSISEMEHIFAALSNVPEF